MNSISCKVVGRVLLVLLFCISCSDNSDLDRDITDTVDDKELYITLDISIPQIAYPYRAVSTRSTYRPQSFDETYLESIDVLIFKQVTIKGEVAEFYVGHTRSEREDIVNCDGSLKQFSVKIKKSVDDEKFRLVVLANASVEIDEVEEQFTPMLTKREVLELISFDTSTAWNSADDTYRCLPMWGQTDAAFAISSTTTGASLGVIPMLRAVARIDVGVDISAQKTSKSDDTLDHKPLFVIDEIRVCNANLKSQVAPYSVEGKGKETRVTSPSISKGVGQTTIKYVYPESKTQVTGEIYIGEALNKDVKDNDKLCLLICGRGQEALESSWYRVDFTHKNPAGQIDGSLDLLRNHLYHINITRIDGLGYPTPEEALSSSILNMEVDVLPWDIAELDDVEFDGTNCLGIDPKEVVVYKEGLEEGSLTINTNLNLNADAITLCQDAAGLEPLADDWLLLGKPLHVSGSATEYRLTYSVEPTSKDRIAYIHFQLGQLRSYVKLTQVAKAYPKVRFELKVEKDGLSSWEQVDQITFIQPKAAEPTKEETYRVIWSDASADVDFMLSGGSIVWTEDITYQNPLDKVPVQKDELSGEVYKEFKVKPQQFSDYAKGSFVTKSETLHVVVDTHRDTPAIGSLQMTQLVADVVVETEVDPYYYLNGEKSNIKVKSNIPWTFYAQYNYGTVCDEIYSGDRAVIKTIDDIEIPPINDSDEQVIVGEVFREANTEGTLVEVVLSNECPSYTLYIGGTSSLIYKALFYRVDRY